jgi:SAM-dependent methyltransferase
MTNRDPYAEVPYPSCPTRHSHPELLAVAGILAGLRPAPIDRCRVLEIGCAEGGNLLPMAAGLPGSEFVGIDPTGSAIERGQRLANELGLRNATLAAKGVEDLDDGVGRFDYIITHGVYSWVAPEVQERILDVTRRLLQPDGLAFVSYNTYPGWHVRGMIREMMIYQARNEASPSGRVARAREFLARLSAAFAPAEKIGPAPTELEAIGVLFRHEHEFLSKFPDGYVYHDHLERINLPIYFSEFAGRAARHGLQYVSESPISGGRLESFPEAVGAVVNTFAKDPIDVQQLMDFAWCRVFRQSILCLAGRAGAPGPERLRGLYVAYPGQLLSPFGRSLTVDDPALKSALDRLQERWPSPVALEELEEKPGRLAEGMLGLLLAGAVEFQSGPPRFTREIAARPTASRLARLQARTSHTVINLRHEQVSLDVLTQAALQLVDGTRDEARLLADLEKTADWLRIVVTADDGTPVTDPAERRKYFGQTLRLFLRHIADSALLEAR